MCETFDESTGASRAVTLRLPVDAAVRALVVAVALLAVAGTASAVLRLNGHLTVLGLVNLLNLDSETSIPTWFSSVLLLAVAALLAVCAVVAHREGRPAANWWVLTAVLAVMSVDEMSAYHEHWSDRLRQATDAGGLLYFTWVVPAAVLLALLAAAQVGFLRSLPRPTARRFLVAAALYVTGALGVEMVNGWYFEQHGHDAGYAVLVGIEEVLEMTGLVVLVRALLLHLRSHVGQVRIDLGDARRADGVRPGDMAASGDRARAVRG